MSRPTSKDPDGPLSTESAWRRQFPIDTVREAQQTRREFVAGTAVAGVTLACGQLGLDMVSPLAQVGEVKEYPALQLEPGLSDLKEGEAIQFHFPDNHSPCLLMKTSAAEVVAFSQKCTHLACPVVPNANSQTLDCPCHRGAFSMSTGMPVSGPPRKALTQVVIAIGEDGTLTATGLRAPSTTT